MEAEMPSQPEETQLERMIRIQNDQLEQQLASTVTSAAKAESAITHINQSLRARLDSRIIQRAASIRRRKCPYQVPATLSDRLAFHRKAAADRKLATEAKATVKHVSYQTKQLTEDTPDNMGFGDLLDDVTSSDDDAEHDNDRGSSAMATATET